MHRNTDYKNLLQGLGLRPGFILISPLILIFIE